MEYFGIRKFPNAERRRRNYFYRTVWVSRQELKWRFPRVLRQVCKRDSVILESEDTRHSLVRGPA
jgi:hypothetical protein